MIHINSFNNRFMWYTFKCGLSSHKVLVNDTPSVTWHHTLAEIIVTHEMQSGLLSRLWAFSHDKTNWQFPLSICSLLRIRAWLIWFNFPDDHSRVLLTEVPGRPGSDYINANYIDVSPIFCHMTMTWWSCDKCMVIFLHRVSHVQRCLLPHKGLYRILCQTSGGWSGNRAVLSLSWWLILKRGEEWVKHTILR